MTSATPIATPKPRERREFERPPTPFDPFPLSWHKHRGYWFKKYRGQTRVYEADAQASYDRWRDDKDAIDKGDKPVAVRKRFELRDAVNVYLSRQERRMTEGKISDAQFAKCRRELQYWLPKAVALGTPLENFRASNPADDGPATLFHRIGHKARARGLDAAHKHITTVRATLDYAAVKKLTLPPDYADDFDPPPLDQIAHARRERDIRHGERTWTVEQVRTILEAARGLREEQRATGPRKNRIPRNHHLYAQILLGLFACYGSDDCSALPEAAINFDEGRVSYVRAKSKSRPCLAFLPKPVIDALKWSRDHRPERNPGAEHLMFVTREGNPCNVAPRHSDEMGVLKVGRNDTIGQNFKRLLKKIGLKKKRMGFKSLRAVGRTLLLGGGVHEDIIAVIMGRKFRYAVDDYYIRGELREEMERAAKHLEKVLLKPIASRRRAAPPAVASRAAVGRKASSGRRRVGK
jgi:integrase